MSLSRETTPLCEAFAHVHLLLYLSHVRDLCNSVYVSDYLFLYSVDLNAADTGVQLKTTVVSSDRGKPGSAETKKEGQCNC